MPAENLKNSFNIVSVRTQNNQDTLSITRATLASAGFSCCLVSVCQSDTSRCSTETAKRRITQTTPHDSPGTLVFCCQKSRQKSNGVTPTGAPNAVGVG